MVRPLAYHSGLSHEDAEKRYFEVRTEFRNVRRDYFGLFGRQKTRQIHERDEQTLSECAGVLLTLGLEGSVQQQTMGARNYRKTLHYRIAELSHEIIDFMANFDNTGVKRI